MKYPYCKIGPWNLLKSIIPYRERYCGNCAIRVITVGMSIAFYTHHMDLSEFAGNCTRVVSVPYEG